MKMFTSDIEEIQIKAIIVLVKLKFTTNACITEIHVLNNSIE